MALIDQVREGWEDLKGTRKEEQQTPSVGQGAGESRTSYPNDLAELVQYVPTRAEGNRQPGNEPLVTLREGERSANQERTSPPQEHPGTILDDHYAMERHDAERYRRLETAVSPRHEYEFFFVEEKGGIDTYKHDPTGNHIHLDSKGQFYDIQEGKEPSLTTRAEVLRAYQEPSPEVAATLSADHREKWVPLEKELGFTGADAFTHYETSGNIQVYMTEVNDSKRVIGLDDKGQFYDVNKGGPGEPISRDQALRSVGVQPSFYTPEERILREAIGNENTVDLHHYSRSGDINSYEYTPTGGSLHLDSDGKFYNAQRQIITHDEALTTMQTSPEGGLQRIAAAPAQAPSGNPEHAGVPQAAVSEMPRSQGPVQQAVQEQSISM